MYQPRPVEKRSVAPQRPQPKIARPVASITINLEELSRISDERARREAEVVETIAAFIPLSSTPAPAHFTEAAAEARELVRVAPAPSTLSMPPARPEDFTPSAKRARLVGALALALIWFAFLASRVGVERALREPLRATRVAFLGEIETQVQLETTQISEVIESGELSARLIKVVGIRGLIAVEAELDNTTSRAQTNIQIKLKATFKGAPPYTESASISCCEPAPAEVSEAWLEGRGRERQGEGVGVRVARLAPEERLRFVHVMPVPPRVRQQTLPEVTLTVEFYEADSAQ
jgi:hypothetical protein